MRLRDWSADRSPAGRARGSALQDPRPAAIARSSNSYEPSDRRGRCSGSSLSPDAMSLPQRGATTAACADARIPGPGPRAPVRCRPNHGTRPRRSSRIGAGAGRASSALPRRRASPRRRTPPAPSGRCADCASRRASRARAQPMPVTPCAKPPTPSRPARIAPVSPTVSGAGRSAKAISDIEEPCSSQDAVAGLARKQKQGNDRTRHAGEHVVHFIGCHGFRNALCQRACALQGGLGVESPVRQHHLGPDLRAEADIASRRGWSNLDARAMRFALVVWRSSRVASSVAANTSSRPSTGSARPAAVSRRYAPASSAIPAMPLYMST